MFDIITFGSATKDNFLKLKKGSFKVQKDKSFPSGKALSFSFGSKINIDKADVFTGGGGTNVATTFAMQGFKTACVVKIGKDKSGEAIMNILKERKVSTDLIVADKKILTDSSFVFSDTGRERTIFVYHGASEELKKKDISWDNLKSKWFFIAPLHGKSAELFDDLANFGFNNGIKIAVNPGNSQINLGMKRLKPILSMADILILNTEEASLLTNIDIKKEKDIIKKLKSLVKGICVVTKGEDGVIVYDGECLYSAGVPQSSFVEKTGAGDAFSAGFVSGIIQSNDIANAIQLGTANATSCIQEPGAKNGLLKKGQWGKWPKVKVKKEKI